ncbi:protein broad-minded isoform X2 [Nematostella vectensis]|uniref:protein broad-minded isoform X2 n=1 Tax=Nematostella vectensis TaxID=45351 RepID=UPI002076E4CE|nr:protein broad-minded isoform X2 [Nematostella vectensis]
MADMENTSDERSDTFFASLDQLFTTLEPVIKEASSVEAAEDILNNLEATDENFHRYDFVRQLRNRIDEALGPVIDTRLEQIGGEGNTNEHLSQIADEVQSSQEFLSLQQSILADTKEAVNLLLQKYANSSLQQGTSEFDLGEYKAAKGQSFRISLDSSDEESSVSSSIDQVGYIFISQEKSGKIAENLDPMKPVHVRCKALGALAQVPQSDIIASEHWSAIRKGLLAALADPDEHLAEKSLKFHARIFLTSSSHAAREIYTCLAEHLWLHFTNSSQRLNTIDEGLNVSAPSNIRLLTRFRLLNEFQHEVPSYWIRYPERFLEEIVESTFSLFSLSTTPRGVPGEEECLSPLWYIALLDPLANWFKKWMHGNYSRTEVLKQLREHIHLLADAVCAVLDFSATLKTALTMPDFFEDHSNPEDTEGALIYSSRDLEFLYFVHSVSLLGRLLLYSDGRALFPIKLSDRQATVTITDLLVAFIKIMCIPLPRFNGKATLDATIVPGELVCEVLQEIAANSAASRECLCKDAITTSLLAPVQNILDGFYDLDGGEESDTEGLLLLVSDVLATLAASEGGRLQLMYGESQDRWQRSSFSPAHIIAGFAKKALANRLPGGFLPGTDVISGFLFVCRQLWTTCEGLIVLNHYSLHEYVADALSKAIKDSPSMSATENSADDSPTDTVQEADNLAWESSLIDNLLNFAGTPKGLLMLQQTGTMNECVGYMYERYTKKLQVSKWEKFGYGVMVSQIAATAPGMVALEKRGYLRRLLQDVWIVLEGSHNRRMVHPRIKHVDTIDSKTYHKALNNLLSVLSSFPAVYEVLADAARPVTSSSEVEEITASEPVYSPPTSLAEFISRLVMMDSEVKIKSLFKYEESHHFGLRVLSVLCSCLDTFLFLESTYRFTELLLDAQLDNRLNNGPDYIIDMCSCERNHILVKTYWVGVPSERIIPDRKLTEVKNNEDPDNPYPWPLFSSFPPPKEYLLKDVPSIDTAPQKDDQVTHFLEGAKPLPAESIVWLEKFRGVFCESLRSGKFNCNLKVVKLLLESVCQALTNVPEEAIFPLIEYSVGEMSLKNTELSAVESLGVRLAVRYGVTLGLLQSSTEGTEDLVFLLKYAKFYMRSQQKVPDSTLRTLSVEYPGHDWFVSTVFLMFAGDLDQSRDFLFKFSSLVCSGYLWMRRLHASIHLPPSLTVSGIPPLYSSTCHNIELILQAELPLVSSAFRMSGYTPSQICQHWLRQCFWNFLPWENICLYVCVCLTLGIDYQVYFCIALFQHLQQRILEDTQRQCLLVTLKEEPIRDFCLSDHLDFMIELERRYRLTILSDLQNITRP